MKGLEAVEAWIGDLSDENLQYKTAPSESSQYYSAMGITMYTVAMEEMENPPLELVRAKEQEMEEFVHYYFDDDLKRATEFLMEIRNNWRPNVVPMWDMSSGEDGDPMLEIIEEYKECAKFHHLTWVKYGAIDGMRKLLLGEPRPQYPTNFSF